jgi:hypothetical protein
MPCRCLCPLEMSSLRLLMHLRHPAHQHWTSSSTAHFCSSWCLWLNSSVCKDLTTAYERLTCRAQVEASSSVGPPAAVSPTRAHRPGLPAGAGGKSSRMSPEAKQEYIAMELLHVWVQMQASSTLADRALRAGNSCMYDAVWLVRYDSNSCFNCSRFHRKSGTCCYVLYLPPSYGHWGHMLPIQKQRQRLQSWDGCRSLTKSQSRSVHRYASTMHRRTWLALQPAETVEQYPCQHCCLYPG